MIYLLDTDVVVALLRNDPAAVRERLKRTLATGASVVVSTVVLFELWYGVARSQRPRENAARLRAFLAGNVGVLPFEESDAAVAGQLRATIEAAGAPIGPYDLLIAAQAQRAGATLVTANVAEFSRVPGLTREDWAS